MLLSIIRELFRPQPFDVTPYVIPGPAPAAKVEAKVAPQRDTGFKHVVTVEDRSAYAQDLREVDAERREFEAQVKPAENTSGSDGRLPFLTDKDKELIVGARLNVDTARRLKALWAGQGSRTYAALASISGVSLDTFKRYAALFGRAAG